MSNDMLLVKINYKNVNWREFEKKKFLFLLVWRILDPFMRSDLLFNVSIIFFTDKEQMPAPKSLVRTFASLCPEKNLLVFVLTVSRLSTILMTERFRVNARTVLMNCLTELAPSKMELAGMFVCLFIYLWGIWGIK